MLRISVIKDGQEFPLFMGSTTETSIDENDALFDLESAVRSGYSMNLSIPIEGNEIALQQAHRVSVREEMDLYHVRVYERNIPSYEATLGIEKSSVSTSEGMLDCNIIFSTFGSRTADVLLKDALKDVVYSLGETPSEIIDSINANLSSTWPAAVVQFPPMRILAEDANGIETKIIANQYDVVNNSIVFCGNNTTNFTKPWIPQFYYVEIIQQLFQRYGYKVKGSALEDAFFAKQLCVNYRPMHTARLSNENIFVTTSPQTINGSSFIQWHSMTFSSSVMSDPPMPSDVFYLPPAAGPWYQLLRLRLRIKAVSGANVKMRVYDRLTSLNLLPIPYFEYDPIPGDELNIMLAPANRSNFLVDYTDKIRIDVIGGSVELDSGCEIIQNITQSNNYGFDTLLFFKPELKLGDYLPPDVSVGEFLNAIKSAFHLKIDIDETNKQVSISTAKDYLSTNDIVQAEQVIDSYTKERIQNYRYQVRWGNDFEPIPKNKLIGTISTFQTPPFIAPPGSFVYVSNENAYYLKDDTTWEYYSIKNEYKEIGSTGDVRQINIPIKLAEVRADATGETNGYLVTFENPYLNHISLQDMLTASNGMSEESWDLTIMTYYGFQPNRNGTQPFVSTVAFLYDGSFINDLYLVFDERNESAFKVYQEPFLKLLSRYVTFKIRLAMSYRKFVERHRGKKISWKNNHFLEVNSNGVLGKDEGVTEIEILRL